MAENTYTPSTDQVRAEWALSNPGGSPTTIMHAEAAFDRWLAAHDAELLEQVARSLGEVEPASGTRVDFQNGADWAVDECARVIRARAAEIRKEQDR